MLCRAAGKTDANISDAWPCVLVFSHTLSSLTKFGDTCHCDFRVRALIPVLHQPFKEFYWMCFILSIAALKHTPWVFKTLAVWSGSAVEQVAARKAL